MTLCELTREQKLELKRRMIDDEIYETEGRGASWGELAEADAEVGDEALAERFGGTEFSEEDFFA